ncbi:hypothetical protein P8C59_004402 [Phyllachora maydis]|uniref:Uncharacterized protein n=1 Tax=Phyllachora maydis TaxID=1825666 RepID=A0AAD9MB96_9PEZI|nr:hypothetical protein P8C59_004402 [Phyllachora maydis]
MASSNAAVRSACSGPLSDFVKLSPNVFLCRPSADATDPPPAAAKVPPPPKVILFASWMGAQDAHIAKYTARYQALFPTAHIVLVRSETRHVRSEALTLRESAAAVPALRAALQDLDPDPAPAPAPDHRPPTSPGTSTADTAVPQQQQQQQKLLIHIMSNGGSLSGATLYRLWADLASASAPSPFPRHTILFDSAPSPFRYGGALAAFTTGCRGIPPWLALPVAHALALWTWALKTLLGRDPLRRWAAAHNDAARKGEGEVRRTAAASS